MPDAALVYPHQLFSRHPARVDGAETWLIEDPLFFGTDRHWPLRIHKHRLALHRASMKAWHRQVTSAGGPAVHYVDLPRGSVSDSLTLA